MLDFLPHASVQAQDTYDVYSRQQQHPPHSLHSIEQYQTRTVLGGFATSIRKLLIDISRQARTVLLDKCLHHPAIFCSTCKLLLTSTSIMPQLSSCQSPAKTILKPVNYTVRQVKVRTCHIHHRRWLNRHHRRGQRVCCILCSNLANLSTNNDLVQQAF